MEQELEEKYKIAFDKIKAAKKILLVTHQRPDTDALASICAFANLLSDIDKKYILYCADAPATNLFYLPRLSELTCDKLIVDKNFSSCDLIITFDCGELSRTGLTDEISSRENQFVIEFDHHIKKSDYSNLEIRDDKAVSTTEILYHFFKVNKIRITKDEASCLLAGILADSGNFFYPNTSDKAVIIASELLSLGARLPEILKNTLRNKSLSGMKLWGIVLKNLQINKKYNLAFSALTIEDMEGFDNGDDVFDSLSGFLSNLGSVKAIVFLKEEADKITGIKKIKGSLRTAHPSVNLVTIARYLGGGGHAKASGFMIEGRLEKNGNSWRVI